MYSFVPTVSRMLVRQEPAQLEPVVVNCYVCTQPTSTDEALRTADGNFVCPECDDAIMKAISGGKRVSH